MNQNGQPDFIKRLRAQIEGEIGKLQDERTTLVPRIEELDQAIEERRAAIRRLIGAELPPKKRTAPVTDEQLIDVIVTMDGEFTPGEVAEVVGLTTNTTKRRLDALPEFVEVVNPGGPGVSSRYRAR